MRKKKGFLNVWVIVLIWILSLTILYPIAMVVVTSFKADGEANFLSINLPKKFMFENYVQVFEEGKILRSFLNSLMITVLAVVLIVLLSSMLGFILARKRNRVNKVIFLFLMLGICAPFAALPTIQLLKILHIYGSRISLVFVYSAMFMPFSTLLITRYITTIPKELDEAAVIDGCTGFSLFFRIIFPLLKPITVTVGVLNFMWVWNDFQLPLYLLNSPSLYTLPLSVYNFFGQYNRNWNLVSADMVLVSIPVVIIYFIAQKYIISGMTAGAVKE